MAPRFVSRYTARMARLQDILAHLDALLQPGRFTDYAPNGLQVEGAPEVSRLVGGVTASQALIEAAIAAGAQAILVHHGWFWRGEDPCIIGMKRQRLAPLVRNDVSLIAYHLPLDAHPVHGNNARLADVLGLLPDAPSAPDGASGPVLPELVMTGRPRTPLTGPELTAHLSVRLAREPLHISPPAPPRIERVAWCSGAAQDYIEAVARAGFDAYISGEVSERTTHAARELGIHYFAAGHHATERYGVQSIGELLAREFDLEFRFIDIDNPV